VDAVPIKRADRSVERVVVSFTDVSQEHRRADDAHRARLVSEERHAAVLRAMSEGVAVHDSTGAIIFSNPAAEMILGLTSEQLRGVEAVDPRWALVTPDGGPVDPTQVPSERTRADGRPCRNEVLGVHRANGERAWLSISTDAIGGSTEGGAPHVVATFTDITTQREAQLALERANARFSAVTSAIPGVLYQALLTPTGLKIVFVAGETQALVGLAPEQILASSFDVMAILHPEDVATAAASLGAHPAQKPLHRMEFRLRRQDEWRWARARATAADTATGLLFTGVIVDITEERRLAAGLQLAQRREAMGDLAAGMAHNFNNMLAAVLPNLHDLRPHLSPPGAPMLDEALSATERAADLVRQLMRLTRGDADGELEVVDVRAIVLEVVMLCRRTFDRSIELQADVVQGPVLARGLSAQLHQALLNLCLNARDALVGRSEPRLTVRLEVVDSALVVVVQDNGSGMDEATLRRLGEPFFTTKPPGRGTGLGVASAMRVAREMGGELSVESTLGVGTTFRLQLPQSAGEAAAAQTERTSTRVGVRSVLLIEDESLVRSAIGRMLKRFAERVEAVDNGPDGLAMIDRGHTFDMVILDLSMPIMSGRAVLREIARRAPALPVIIMSGNVSDRSGLEAAAEVVEKPITPKELEEIVARVAERTRHSAAR
jgi:PAS domain S-box-containing protein